MRCNGSITLPLGEGGNCQRRNDDLNTLFHEREITRKQWKGRKKKVVFHFSSGSYNVYTFEL